MAEENKQNKPADNGEASKSKPAEAKPTAAKSEKPASSDAQAPKSKPAEDKPAAAKSEKPAAAKKPKKEKPPALEDKPFVEFMEKNYVPALEKAMTQKGVEDLQLSFAKQKVPVIGFENAEDCWQIEGRWRDGQRQFNLYFPDEDIKGKKGFSCNEGKKPSTMESFLIDERKITLDLMVFGLMQRLNGQKWLGIN